MQDQLRAMQQLLEAAFGDDRPFVDVYDGDTPKVRPPPPLPKHDLHLFLFVCNMNTGVARRNLHQPHHRPQTTVDSQHVPTLLWEAGGDSGLGGAADDQFPSVSLTKSFSHETSP